MRADELAIQCQNRQSDYTDQYHDNMDMTSTLLEISTLTADKYKIFDTCSGAIPFSDAQTQIQISTLGDG
jgi:hypothetical protein